MKLEINGVSEGASARVGLTASPSLSAVSDEPARQMAAAGPHGGPPADRLQ